MLWSAEVFTQKPAGLTQAVYAIKFSLQLEGQGRKPSKRTKSLILSPCKECFCPFVSCPVHRLCSPPSICSHRRGAMKGKAISILPAHRRSGSMGAELKSCILMRCCCATRAEQSRAGAAGRGGPGEQNLHGTSFFSRLFPPPQCSLQGSSCCACFASSIHPAGHPIHSWLFCPTSVHNLFLIPRSAPPCLTLDTELNSCADLGHEELEKALLHPLCPAWGKWIFR